MRCAPKAMVLAVVASAALCLDVEAAESERPKLVVLELQSEGGLSEGTVRLLNELLVTEFARPGLYQVVGGSDIRAVLAAEEQKQLMGCDSTSCLVEIAGALGGEYIAVASVGPIGEFFLMNLKVLNASTAALVGRVSKKLPQQEGDLLDEVPVAVRAVLQQAGLLAGTPAVTTVVDRDESFEIRPLPAGLIGVGVAGVAVGAIFGVRASQANDRAKDNTHVGAQLEIDRSKSAERNANISYAIGIVSAAVGIVLWIMGDDESSKAQTAGVHVDATGVVVRF